MPHTRRTVLTTAASTTVLGCRSLAAAPAAERRPALEELDRAAAKPVLRLDSLRSPVKIASLELLRNGRNYLVRVRSTDGAEGVIVPNEDRMRDVYPVFLRRVAPFFIGKDARELEPLLDALYRQDSNYKFQGLALWVPVAAAEFAILDMLGKIARKPLTDLLGGARRRDIAIYSASGNRGNTPEQEIEYLRKMVAESGAKALKFRLGGRMNRNIDSLPGRTERLIPLVREAFGDAMTLYADANSSYDVPKAIEIGRLMEKYRYGFYEEPVPFDELAETKQVADALTLPGREWGAGVQHGPLPVVHPPPGDGRGPARPSLFRGVIRCMRVARMAAEAGLPVTLHMGGTGLGYLDALHLMACIPNALEYQEYKGLSGLPVTCDTSTLKPKDGMVRVPSGPGFGHTLDRDWVSKAEVV